MKATTLTKRLASRYSGSKNCNGYKMAVDVINGKTLLRPCWTSGSGRFTSNMDYTRDVCAILNLIGVSYEVGNDSPRGGKTGTFVRIKTKIV